MRNEENGLDELINLILFVNLPMEISLDQSKQT